MDAHILLRLFAMLILAVLVHDSCHETSYSVDLNFTYIYHSVYLLVIVLARQINQNMAAVLTGGHTEKGMGYYYGPCYVHCHVVSHEQTTSYYSLSHHIRDYYLSFIIIYFFLFYSFF